MLDQADIIKKAKQENPKASDQFRSYVDSMVETLLYKQRDTYFCRVQIHCSYRPELCSHMDLQLDAANSMEEFKKIVGQAGEALAAYQNRMYSDFHEPDTCAKLAMEAFEEMWYEVIEKPGATGQDKNFTPIG